MGVEVLSSRAIIGTFYEVLEGLSKVSWVDKVSMLFTSDQPSEEYRWLGMSPVMREWIGGRQAKGLRANGIEIENLHFEATLEFFVKELRRDKTPQIRLRISELAERSITHWASLLSTLIENGETTPCYDGQYFFDTDHVEGDSGTLSNDISSSDYGELNVGTASNPTPSEMADVIMKLIQHQYMYKDDQGEPMNEDARNFMVMVPVNMFGAAQTAVRANLLNTGSGARDNPLALSDFNVDVVANPRLSWTTKLALFRTDGRVAPFIRQQETGTDVMLKAIAEGSELEFNEDKHRYGIDTWRNVGYGFWQYATLATLS